MRIKISEKIGKISAAVVMPEIPMSLLVLAHGAGSGMMHPFMTSLSNELLKHSVATLRFNFPFIELKKGRPDIPAVAHATIETVIQEAEKKFPDIPLFAGGKSFGGRMTSQLLASKDIVSVRGVIFFGFPLHPPGNPSLERAEHLRGVKPPMLFLQGTRDALAEIPLIQKVVKQLKKGKLVKFEGADHSFKSPQKNLIPGLANIAAKWMLGLLDNQK